MGINILGEGDDASRSKRKPAHREDLSFLMYTEPDVVEVGIGLHTIMF